MDQYDSMVDRWSRSLAKASSRRGVLQRLGNLLVGAAVLPLLPIARGQAANANDQGDPATCEYWRYCAIDGFLCACCGGSVTSCPPGTETAPITWVGTCRN